MTAPHYGYWPQPEMAGMQPRLMQPQAPPAMPSLAMKPVPYYPESAHPQMLPSYGAPATYYNHSGAVVQPPPPQQQQHPQAVPPPPTTPPTITYYSNANAGPQVVSPHQHTQPRPRPAVSPSGRLPAHPQPPRMPTSTLWRAPPPVTTTPAHTWVASDDSIFGDTEKNIAKNFVDILAAQGPQEASSEHIFNCFLKLSPTERKVVMKPGSIKSFLLAMGVITVERNLMSVRPDVLESLYDPEDKALPDEGEEEELDSQQLMFEQKASQHNITIEIAPTAATSAAARRSSSGTYSAQNSLCSEEDEEPPETGAAIRVEEVEKTEVGVNTLTPSTCEQASETEVITRNRRLQVGPPQLAEPNHIACGPDDKGESDFIETIDSLQYDEMVSRAITAEEALLKLRLTMKFNDAINFKTRILAAYNNLSGVQQRAAWPEYERVCAELAACMEDLQSECESNIEQLQEEGVWLRDLVEDKLTLPDVPPLLQEAANTKPLEVVHRTPVVEISDGGDVSRTESEQTSGEVAMDRQRRELLLLFDSRGANMTRVLSSIAPDVDTQVFVATGADTLSLVRRAENMIRLSRPKNLIIVSGIFNLISEDKDTKEIGLRYTSEDVVAAGTTEAMEEACRLVAQFSPPNQPTPVIIFSTMFGLDLVAYNTHIASYTKELSDILTASKINAIAEDQELLDSQVLAYNNSVKLFNKLRKVPTPYVSQIVHMNRSGRRHKTTGRPTYTALYHLLDDDGCHLTEDLREKVATQLISAYRKIHKHVKDEVETKAQPVGTAPAPPQPAVSGTHPHMPAGPQTTSNPAPLQGWPSQQVPNSSCLNSGSSTTSITTVATTPADLTTTTTATTTTTTSTNISASTPSPLATPQVMVNPLALLNQQALVSAQGMPPNQQGLANPQCLPVARPGVPLGAPQGIPTPQGMVSPHLLPMLQPMMMSLARVNPALAMQPQLLQNTALQHLLTMQRAGMGLPSSAPSQQSAPSPSSTPPPALPSPSAMAAVPAGLGNVSPASSLGSGTFPALNPFMLPAGNMPMLPMPVVSSSPSLSATSSETGALSSSMQNLLDLQLKQTEASLSMGGLPTATSGAAALNQYAMFQQRLLSSASSTLPSFLEMQMKTTMQSTLAAMQSTTQVTSVNQAPAPSTLPAPAPAPAPAPSTTLPAPSVSSAPVAVSAPAVSQATPPTPTGNISRPPGFGVSDTGKQNNLPVLNIPVSKKTREPSPASSHSSSSKPRKPSTPKLTKKETDTKLTTNTAANVENKPQEKPIAVPKKTAAKKIPQVIKLVQKQKQEQVQPQSPIKQSILPSTYGNSQATYVPQRRDTSLDVTSTENWDDECNSFITQTAFILGKSKIASNRRATTPPVNLDEPKPPPIIPVVTKSLPSSMVYKAEAGSGHKTVVAPAAGDQWPDLRSANGGKDNRSTTTVNKAGGSWNEGIATRRKPLPIIASSIPDQVPVNRIDYGDSSRSLTGTIESGAGHRGGGDSVEKPLKSAKSAPPPPAPTPEKSKVLKESGGGSKQSGGGRLTALDDFTVPETQPTDDEWQESGKRGKKKPKFKTMPAGDGKENSNFDRLVAQMMTKFPDRTKTQAISLIQQVRTQHGSLTGMRVDDIVAHANRLLKRWKTSGAEIIESKNVNMGNLLYKTSICEFWKAGNCSNGDKCVYAHGRNDLRAPPKHILCSNWKKLGRCPRASTCLFAHGETELVPATVPPAGKVKKTLKQLHEKKAPPATSTSAITWAQIPNTKNQVQAQADSQESDEEEDEGEECTICCDAMSQKTLKKLECGHEFHASCITRWIEGEERTCPLCRSHALLIEDYPYLGQ